MKILTNIIIGVFALLVGVFINKAIPNAFIPSVILFIPPYIIFLILKRKITFSKAILITAKGFVCYIAIIFIFITSYYIIVTPDAEYSAAGVPIISNSSNIEDALLVLKASIGVLIFGILLFISKSRLGKIYKLIICYRNRLSKIGYGLLFTLAVYEYWNERHLVAAIVGIGTLIAINLDSVFKTIKK
jgi:hypothetical protein